EMPMTMPSVVSPDRSRLARKARSAIRAASRSVMAAMSQVSGSVIRRSAWDALYGLGHRAARCAGDVCAVRRWPADPDQQLGAEGAVDDLVADRAAGGGYLKGLGEHAAGQAQVGGVQQHRAGRLSGAQLGESVVGGGTEDQYGGAVLGLGALRGEFAV